MSRDTYKTPWRQSIVVSKGMREDMGDEREDMRNGQQGMLGI